MVAMLAQVSRAWADSNGNLLSWIGVLAENAILAGFEGAPAPEQQSKRIGGDCPPSRNLGVDN